MRGQETVRDGADVGQHDSLAEVGPGRDQAQLEQALYQIVRRVFRAALIDQDRLLTIREAARIRRCRREEIRNLVRNGKLPAIQRGGRLFILRETLRELLRAEEAEKKSSCNARRPVRRKSSTRLEDLDPDIRAALGAA